MHWPVVGQRKLCCGCSSMLPSRATEGANECPQLVQSQKLYLCVEWDRHPPSAFPFYYYYFSILLFILLMLVFFFCRCILGGLHGCN